MVAACTGIYQMRCTAYKVAPENALIQSETYRASNGKQRTIKSNHKNFVHLGGLYTYCKMMHGAYKVKFYTLCLRRRQRTSGSVYGLDND